MKHSFKLTIAAYLSAITVVTALAEAPDGYYSSCEGLSGEALLTALCDKITSHTPVGYDGLWSVYQTSDVRDDGTVWDMYSTKHWVIGKEHCGTYRLVGDCINREHTIPQSVFNDASPMVCDAFHVYPTDGKVNGQRSNYPHGVCANGTTLPSNDGVQALGKLGTSTYPGYSGKVFEPADEYKGDFARTYFYFVACYNRKVASWNFDMFDGTSYPALSSWAQSMLLEWHRQDPVSDKETVRNDAVYKSQKNRNPFIDHPDLAEHIWGDKRGMGWSATEQLPSIFTPVNGSTIDLGVTAVSRTVSRSINVTGVSLSGNVNASISGSGWSVTPSSLSASTVCTAAGANLTVTFAPTGAGTSTATLTLTSGGVTSRVTLSAKAMDGIPVGSPTFITDRSFVANWVNISGPADRYTLSVWHEGEAVSGYPVQVNAADESHEVINLEPSTTYTYQLSQGSLRSDIVTVTTGEAIPSIQFLYDGDLNFTSSPGVASDIAEVLLDIENIDSPITISVTEPFRLSSDKATWGTSLSLDPEEDRFYMQVLAATAGQYTTSLTATAGDYTHSVTISATVGVSFSLVEDFEKSAAGLGNYNGGTYHGSDMDWQLTNAGIYAGNSEPYHSENQSVRFGKTGAAGVTMLADKPHGIGTVTFYARKWNNDAAPTLELRYSADSGKTWEKIGEGTAPDEGQWKEFSFDVNRSGNGRIAIMRPSATGSSRLNLDDISVSDYTVPSGISTPDYHTWDAYCRDHQLVVEAAEQSGRIRVFGVDGVMRFDGVITTGSITLPLPAGLYIVNSDTFSRRVLVK